MILRAVFSALLGFSLALAAGCSADSGPPVPRAPTFSVKGRVFCNDKPLVDGLVIFHPADDPGGNKPLSHGRTDKDGYFTLSTYEPDDGAPAGSYKVGIMLLEGEDGINLLPMQYASPFTSGLAAQIKPQDNDLVPFRIRRP